MQTVPRGDTRTAARLAGGRRRPLVARPGAIAAIIMVLLSVLAGCSSIDAALSRDWAVVIFKQNASVTELLQVRAACAHLPDVVLQAPPSGQDPLTAIYALRYDTSSASPADIVRLRDCLQRFKSVAGVTFQNALPPGTDGG